MKLSAHILRTSYRLVSRVLFGNGDHADWMYEKMQRPRSIYLTALNLLYYWSGRPRIAGLTSVVVEPVYGCNLRCKTCWGRMPYKPIRPPRMAWDTFARVIDTMPSSVESVTFSLAGEPTLHDDLGRMIEYAHQAGVRVVLATNGTLLKGERLERVANSPLSVVNVSAETDPEMAREIRGVDLDELRENIRQLVARKRPTLEVKLALVAHDRNAERIADVQRDWADLIDYVKVSPIFSFNGQDNTRVCMELWRGNINVLTDGKVMPCCVSIFGGDLGDLVIGNVNEEPLTDIVNGERYRKLLTDSLDGRPPTLCRSCSE
ncbi:MAG: radical SAM protein, partial [Phycisphaerae bacterium]|nr:radical SAM protein [Phycisphaerae bacterium]